MHGLFSTLKRAETNSGLIPKQILRIIKEDAWRAWWNPESDVKGGEGFAKATDIREFLRKPWPQGCGSSVSLVERLLMGTDAWLEYVKVCGGGPGASEGNQNARKTNTDIIRNCSDDPAIIPITQPKPKRDRSNDMPGGTSRIADIRRLAKETEAGAIDPAIFPQVERGEVTPHRGMVLAGLRDESITIPADPIKAARRLLKHFQGESLVTLISELSRGGGHG